MFKEGLEGKKVLEHHPTRLPIFNFKNFNFKTTSNLQNFLFP